MVVKASGGRVYTRVGGGRWEVGAGISKEGKKKRRIRNSNKTKDYRGASKVGDGGGGGITDFKIIYYAYLHFKLSTRY